MSDLEAPQNQGAEESVLGALLVYEPALKWVIDDTKLKTGDFYFEKHRVIYSSITRLYSSGNPVDSLTVVEDLRSKGLLDVAQGENTVMGLAESVSAPGNARAHAEIVADLARWRGRQLAFYKGLEAVRARDRGMIGEVEAMLSQQVAHSTVTYNEAALSIVLEEMLTGEEEDGEVFTLPLDGLNHMMAGGLRRGELTLVSGHTSHGKSVFVDQALDVMRRAGAKTRLYMNEMGIKQRLARRIAQKTGFRYSDIIRKRLSEEQREKVRAMRDLIVKHELTPCAGWSAEEIAADIRANRPDVAAIDMVTRIPVDPGGNVTAQWERVAGILSDVAHQADCTVIGTVQLNRGTNSNRQGKSKAASRPVKSDIKNSSAFEQNSDNILFVHRQEDKDGDPTPKSWIIVAKNRNGPLGFVDSTFVSSRFEFEKREESTGDPGPTPPPNEAAEKDFQQDEMPF